MKKIKYTLLSVIVLEEFVSKGKLFISVVTKFLIGLVFVGLLLFLPARTFSYKNGWLFIGLLFIPMFILGIVLFVKFPELLEKRLSFKEKEGTQKGVVAFSALIFLGGFIIAGLDFRFYWSYVPLWVEIVACVILLVSYGLYGEVMRENSYLSRTVEVQKNQKVIDTGLYGIIRHPMYVATIFLFLSIPLVLGSWWSFVLFLFYPVVIVVRIKNEEKVLSLGLAGYSEYMKKVPWRLIPFVW